MHDRNIYISQCEKYSFKLPFGFIELYECDAELWTHSIAAGVAAPWRFYCYQYLGKITIPWNSICKVKMVLVCVLLTSFFIAGKISFFATPAQVFHIRSLSIDFHGNMDIKYNRLCILRLKIQACTCWWLVV